VCKILKQLVTDPANPYTYKSALLSVSPEEVESVLCCDFDARSLEDSDAGCVPSSPEIFNCSVQLLPVSSAPVSPAVLDTLYLQADLSSPASSLDSRASSACVPYSIGSRPDRKLKKKEQNKTAALRYRNKKREEKGVVYTEVEELEHRNEKLQARADDLTKEINYLKSLLDEIKRQ